VRKDNENESEDMDIDIGIVGSATNCKSAQTIKKSRKRRFSSLDVMDICLPKRRKMNNLAPQIALMSPSPLSLPALPSVGNLDGFSLDSSSHDTCSSSDTFCTRLSITKVNGMGNNKCIGDIGNNQKLEMRQFNRRLEKFDIRLSNSEVEYSEDDDLL